MAVYRCSVCDTVFDEKKEGKKWEELPEEWNCHVCESGKSVWKKVDEENVSPDVSEPERKDISGSPDEFLRLEVELEVHMADIHQMARSGKSIIEPMRTRKPLPSWDDILIKGAQLAKIPLNREAPVNTKTVIGHGAKAPLLLETPVYVTQMSYWALSKEAKIALATGSAAAKTAMCSGEGVSFRNPWIGHTGISSSMFPINTARPKKTFVESMPSRSRSGSRQNRAGGPSSGKEGDQRGGGSQRFQGRGGYHQPRPFR